MKTNKSISPEEIKEIIQQILEDDWNDYLNQPASSIGNIHSAVSDINDVKCQILSDLIVTIERWSTKRSEQLKAKAADLSDEMEVSIALPTGNSWYALRKFGESLFIATLAVLMTRNGQRAFMPGDML